MAKRSKIAVTLTQEAKSLLALEPIFQLVLHDSTLTCSSVVQNGEFLDLEVDHVIPAMKKTLKAKISIPGRFVLYMLSFRSEAALGFKLDELLPESTS